MCVWGGDEVQRSSIEDKLRKNKQKQNGVPLDRATTVAMLQRSACPATYGHFGDHVLPRILRDGPQPETVPSRRELVDQRQVSEPALKKTKKKGVPRQGERESQLLG